MRVELRQLADDREEQARTGGRRYGARQNFQPHRARQLFKFYCKHGVRTEFLKLFMIAHSAGI